MQRGMIILGHAGEHVLENQGRRQSKEGLGSLVVLASAPI